MLVIKIEIWPWGDHTQARPLGVATIANVGGSDSSGQYEARLFKTPDLPPETLTKPTPEETWRAGKVEGFPRLALGPWHLLFRALGSLLSDHNPVAS